MLDNYLKEVISFRQWNVLEESYLMTHIKEELCYVSLDFKQDLNRAKFVFSRILYNLAIKLFNS